MLVPVGPGVGAGVGPGVGAGVGPGVGAGAGGCVGWGRGPRLGEKAAAGDGAAIDSTTGRAAAAAAPAPSLTMSERRETSAIGPETVIKPASTRSAIAKATISWSTGVSEVSSTTATISSMLRVPSHASNTAAADALTACAVSSAGLYTSKSLPQTRQRPRFLGHQLAKTQL